MQRNQFEILPASGKWSKILVIAGLPGNRGDLVLGWLSNNPAARFLPCEWFLDPVYGKNLVPTTWSWASLDVTSNIAPVLQSIFEDQYCENAPWFATKSHLTSSSLLKLIPNELAKYFVVLDLLVKDKESMDQVRWESFVKNYVRRLNSDNPLVKQQGEQELRNWKGLGSEGLSSSELLLEIYDSISHKIKYSKIDANPAFNSSFEGATDAALLTMDYSDIMTDRGPMILSGTLDLDLDLSGWSSPLAMTRSRDGYWCQGRYFSRPIP